MPVSNIFGNLLSGVGTAHINIDNIPLWLDRNNHAAILPYEQAFGLTSVVGGRGGWLTDYFFVFNCCQAIPLVDLQGNDLPITTGCKIVGCYTNKYSKLVQLFHQGANTLVAEDNIWAAWNSSGLYFSDGYKIPNESYPIFPGPPDIGQDGQVGFRPDYQVGVGYKVRNKNGEIWDLTNELVEEIQLLSGTQAIWTTGGVIKVHSLPTCIQVAPGSRARAAYLGNKWWVAYYTPSLGIICHPFDSPYGYKLNLYDHAYYHELRILDSFRLELDYSFRAGEFPGDSIRLAIDTTLPRTNLTNPNPPEDPMKKPEVTVDNWTLDELKDGREFLFHDRENPDLGYSARVYVKNGSMYAEISNKEGKGSTGKYRPVKECDSTPEPIPPDPIPPDPPNPNPGSGIKLVGDKFFRRQNGDRMTLIESSDFSLFKRYLDSDWATFDPTLQQRVTLGFNCLRVWLLNDSVVAFRNGVQQDGIRPNQYLNFYDRLRDFCLELDSVNLCVELTVFTQTQTLMPDPAEQQDHLEKTAQAVNGLTNVLLELVNENDQHDNAVSPSLVRPSGNIIISHGSNGADQTGVRPTWDYELYHTNGLNEWQRKTGHNAMEKADESGVPAVSNENTRYPDNDSSSNHAYDAMAGAALLCAGACFHSQGGKFSRVFDSIELECAKSWIAGALSVPLEFQAGTYKRHDELVGPDCIRAYSRTLSDGRSHLVKIRP